MSTRRQPAIAMKPPSSTTTRRRRFAGRWTASTSVFWLILAFSASALADRLFPSKDSMAEWASKLDSAFEKIVVGNTDITGAEKLQQVYSQQFDGEINHARGTDVIVEMKEKISEIFEKNIVALKNLHQRTEDLIKNYEYKSELTLSEVDYVNVNSISGNVSSSMEYRKHYKQDVNLMESGVHIPIEIYDGYPYILNGIQWSRNLTEVFIENRKAYPGIYWQTFGSQDGFLRVYPLSRWHSVEGLPDLFDVRRRPWYIHGTSSPKDMVILLDVSGSMHGQSFDIMKLAAKTLVNTLGENDYVNIASFSKNVSWVTPCLTTLVQANTRNKRLLFDGIDRLEARFMANYSKALEFAYEALETFETERDPSDESGANCHKLIMVFSDGGTEYPHEIIKVYTNGTRPITSQARIFTYAVGPHPLPVTALKNMACVTNGSFSAITAMGAIRTTIQDYVGTLNVPLALAHKTTDFSQDTLGLGFVTTVTLPVFNTSRHSDNQTLAGIVGIDIPVTRFEFFAPRAVLGPLGYAFGMNTNGFLIFHPSLWLLDNYLEDPAHNDFSDVEGDFASLNDVRKEMIDLAYNQDAETVKMKEINISAVVHHGHAIPNDVEYHYAAVSGTNFSLGIVVPKNWNYITVPVGGNNVKTEVDKLGDEQVLIAPWNYCEETSAGFDSLEDIRKMPFCSGQGASRLAFDLKHTRNTFESLTPEVGNEDFISRFVITDGGLIRYKPPRARSSYAVNPYNSSLYRMATASSKPILFIDKKKKPRLFPKAAGSGAEGPSSRHASDEESRSEEDVYETLASEDEERGGVKEPTVHLVNKFVVNDGSRKSTVGIAGVELSHNYLQKMLLQVASNGEELSCQDAKNVYCYLVDLSGYVLASNQRLSKVTAGSFLGVPDPHLMAYLLKEKNYFDERPVYDYLALCESKVDCSGSAHRLLPGLKWSLDLLSSLVRSLFGALYRLNFAVLNTLLALHLPAQTESSLLEFGNRIADGMHRCTTKTSNWFLKPGAFREGQQVEGSFRTFCPGQLPSVKDNATEESEPEKKCNRAFHMYRLKNVDAIFLVAERPTSTVALDGSYIEFSDSPVEVESEQCHLPQRYRKRPPECYARHEDETGCDN